MTLPADRISHSQMALRIDEAKIFLKNFSQLLE